MDYESRSELILKIQSKIDELMELISDPSVSKDCMAVYCFGINVEEVYNQEAEVYEYFSGFSADNPEEIKIMLETVAKSYISSIGKPNAPTDSIDYWLNL